jgi:cytochrome P450
VIIGGYRIPAKTAIIPQIASVLFDERLFDKPTEFRPERFLLADMNTTNKEAIDNVKMEK